MSYCRFSPSCDVYVFRSGAHLFCAACQLEFAAGHEGSDFVANGPAEMLEHLTQHRDRGHKVWEGAFERLRKECETDAV